MGACTLDFTAERNADLLRAYRHHCASVSFIRLSDIGRRIAESPARRFWVSERRAMIVCSQIMRGIPVLDSMRPSKREMFTEIYRRVIALRERHPDWPLVDLAAVVVNSPAPKFYMKPSSIIEYLFKIRSGWYERKEREKERQLGSPRR